MAWSGYEQRARLVRWLHEQGIAWFPGRNGAVCTTTEAINNRLIERKEVMKEEIDFA